MTLDGYKACIVSVREFLWLLLIRVADALGPSRDAEAIDLFLIACEVHTANTVLVSPYFDFPNTVALIQPHAAAFSGQMVTVNRIPTSSVADHIRRFGLYRSDNGIC